MNKVTIIHDLAQPLNLATENSIRSIADFEPVVFRWVVRGGNNNTTLSFQVTDGEIEDRAGTDTQISHVEAGVEHSFQQSLSKCI